MEKHLSVAVEKVVSQPKDGRWAGVLEFVPESEEDLKKRGRLFAILDLSARPGLNLAQFGQQALQAFQDFYYVNTNASPLLALEEAINQAKQRLKTLVKDTDSLSYSFAAASLWGTFLYLAKFGSAKLHFKRGEEVEEVGEEVVDRVFAASGMVHPQDELTLGSGDLTTSLVLRFEMEKVPTAAEALHLIPTRRRRLWWRRILNRRSLVALSLLLFLLASFYTLNKRQAGLRSGELARLVNLANQKVEEAKPFVDLNNVKAREILLEARQSLEDARLLSPDSTEINEKSAEIDRLLDKVSKITRLSELPLWYDLKIQREDVSPAAITGSSEALFISDPVSGTIFRLTLSEPPEVAPLGGVEKKRPGVSLIYYGDGNLYFKSDDGVGVDKTMLEVESPADIMDLKTFLGNIYLLVPVKNQILKFTALATLSGVAEGYSVGSGWLAADVDISDAVSLTIDGAIYVLKKDGRLLKFEKGNLVGDFEIKGLDKPLDKPQSIFTTVGSEYLYILDAGNKRVVVIRKTGFYHSQYRYEGDQAFLDPKGLFVDEGVGAIYLLDGTKIYRIKI
jgi:hypothetical protein